MAHNMTLARWKKLLSNICQPHGVIVLPVAQRACCLLEESLLMDRQHITYDNFVKLIRALSHNTINCCVANIGLTPVTFFVQAGTQDVEFWLRGLAAQVPANNYVGPQSFMQQNDLFDDANWIVDVDEMEGLGVPADLDLWTH